MGGMLGQVVGVTLGLGVEVARTLSALSSDAGDKIAVMLGLSRRAGWVDILLVMDSCARLIEQGS